MLETFGAEGVVLETFGARGVVFETCPSRLQDGKYNIRMCGGGRGSI